MARIVVAKRITEDIRNEAELDAAIKAFSLAHPGTYCHGSVTFGQTVIVAFKHRSYGDVGQWHALDGYYRNGKLAAFTAGERITQQNAGNTCQ